MEDFSKLLLAVFGGVIVLAIISVIVGRNSRAPEAISALTGGLSNVVSASVQPVNTAATNGDNGSNAYSSPALPAGWFGNVVNSSSRDAMNQVLSGLNIKGIM